MEDHPQRQEESQPGERGEVLGPGPDLADHPEGFRRLNDGCYVFYPTLLCVCAPNRVVTGSLQSKSAVSERVAVAKRLAPRGDAKPPSKSAVSERVTVCAATCSAGVTRSLQSKSAVSERVAVARRLAPRGDAERPCKSAVSERVAIARQLAPRGDSKPPFKSAIGWSFFSSLSLQPRACGRLLEGQ